MRLGPRWFREMDPEAIGLGLATFFAFVQAAAQEHPDAISERHAQMRAWLYSVAMYRVTHDGVHFCGVSHGDHETSGSVPARPMTPR